MAAIEFPSATYRLQLSSGPLPFEQVGGLVDYFRRLGIGALYLSPFLRAAAGSTHGYDVVDPTEIEPRLGTEEDLGRLADRLREAGLGMMVDIVPNHMGVADPHNRWWQDVLEHGPGSQSARFFDIDWNPPKDGLRGKVLLPVLGDQFGKVLEEQQLQLVYDGDRLVLRYFDRTFPTDPATWASVLGRAVEMVSGRLDPDASDRMELESIVTALEHLPSRSASDAEAVQQRYRESEVARRRLAGLLDESHEIQCALERAVIEFNGRPGEPVSFDRLEKFVTDQPYRLCYWRVATDEINYRRFFDIDSLAAIRVEDPEVFQAVHEATLRFIQRGWVTALRIDHADGLHDPSKYLSDLAEAVRGAQGGAESEDPTAKASSMFTVVEKILGADESLPADWRVHGTTGYDFLNLLNGVFVDRLGAYGLRDAYVRFLGDSLPLAEVLHDSKRAILSTSLSAELYVLSNSLDRISEQHRWSRDFTRLSLHRGLREVIACFPVYRTYIRPEDGNVREEDQKRIDLAIRAAKRRNPAMSSSFFDFIRSVLMLEHPRGLSVEEIAERELFIYRFQQFTGPVIAKGLEDTAFYRYFPLASLCEVGSDPMVVGTSVEQFHRRTSEQQERWPHTLLATGTHDTKRGEDLRARLNVLSEFPAQWEAAIRRWHELSAEARQDIDGATVPDANEEYLIYQTLVGTWPVAGLDEQGRGEYTERIVQYVDKALRESKLHTSWLNPYEEYDQAVSSFIRTILADFGTPLIADLAAFAASIADAGFVNSLSQTLVKMCAPGVPDFYQGTEFWDFSLVDPDNRRPVDFVGRQNVLEDLELRAEENLSVLSGELLARWPDERLKMLLIWRVLTFRREHGRRFEGKYLPLSAEGERKGNICALARVADDGWAVCVVPRMAAAAWREIQPPGAGGNSNGRAVDAEHGGWRLAPWWANSALQLPREAPRRWRHVVTGHELEAVRSNEGAAIELDQIFESFPVALLAAET